MKASLSITYDKIIETILNNPSINNVDKNKIEVQAKLKDGTIKDLEELIFSFDIPENNIKKRVRRVKYQ